VGPEFWSGVLREVRELQAKWAQARRLARIDATRALFLPAGSRAFLRRPSELRSARVCACACAQPARSPSASKGEAEDPGPAPGQEAGLELEAGRVRALEVRLKDLLGRLGAVEQALKKQADLRTRMVRTNRWV
jgi:hypothetical protein